MRTRHEELRGISKESSEPKHSQLDEADDSEEAELALDSEDALDVVGTEAVGVVAVGELVVCEEVC